MKNAFLILLCAFVFQPVFGEDLFRNCESAIKDENYKKLKEYLLSTEENKYLEDDICQRLNNNEFLYGDYYDLHYCKFISDKQVACESSDSLIRYRSLGVRKSFYGGGNKQFVLLSRGSLSHGVFGVTFSIFFFVPKTENAKGYKLVDMKDDVGAYHGLNSDEGNLCSNLDISESAIEPIGDGFEILNEGNSNVGIRFNQKITSCKTMKASKQVLEYTWSGKDFVLTNNTLIPWVK